MPLTSMALPSKYGLKGIPLFCQEAHWVTEGWSFAMRKLKMI